MDRLRFRHTILAAVLLLCVAFAAGCSLSGGEKPDEKAPMSETQEEKIRIGISFDSFVIERWLRDRDVFVETL